MRRPATSPSPRRASTAGEKRRAKRRTPQMMPQIIPKPRGTASDDRHLSPAGGAEADLRAAGRGGLDRASDQRAVRSFHVYNTSECRAQPAAGRELTRGVRGGPTASGQRPRGCQRPSCRRLAGLAEQASSTAPGNRRSARWRTRKRCSELEVERAALEGRYAALDG